jgi:hypothetical protein
VSLSGSDVRLVYTFPMPGQPGEEGPELFFALVYPIGTHSEVVQRALIRSLSSVGYRTPSKLHIIDDVYSGQ